MKQDMPRNPPASAIVQIDRTFSVNDRTPAQPAAAAQPYNKDVRVLRADVAEALSAAELTEIVNEGAVALLGKQARSKATIPFTGNPRNNPYAAALMMPVPLSLYVPSNVWHRDEQGNAVFEPWLWRLGTTPAMNLFSRHYNTINSGGDANSPRAFPLDEWNQQKRRVRNRGYKRNQRERALGT